MFVSVPVCAVLYCLLSEFVCWLNKQKHPEPIAVAVVEEEMPQAEKEDVSEDK